MRLSEIINEAIDANTDADGRCNTHDAIASARNRLTDDHRDHLINAALAKEIKDAASRGKAQILAHLKENTKELPFDGLRSGYALDLEDRYIKRVENLMRAEMERVIQIREQQIIADQSHLRILRNAYMAVKPIWDTNPDWTFGECCQLLARRRAA